MTRPQNHAAVAVIPLYKEACGSVAAHRPAVDARAGRWQDEPVAESESAEGLREYAERRGLEFAERAPVPPVTPLLTKGDVRSFSPALRGTLPGGIEGVLARYRYRRSGEGGGRVFTFTVISSELPESSAYVPRLICERRGRSTDNVHYGFEMRSEKLWQESEALDRRYRITMGPYQDENWMRQLFSPAFIVWLAEEPPPTFSFELTYGSFCASIEEDHTSEAELDSFCEGASYTAERILQECRE